MLRSDFLMKLMSVVLFIAVVAYIGLYIFNAADKPLKTATAYSYTVEDSGSTEGYVVRSETVLQGETGTPTLMAGEGEKVASGQTVAVYYEGDAALQRASEIRVLQLKIKEAEADLAASSNLHSLDTDKYVLALSNAIQHQQLGDLEDLTYSIRTLVFTGSNEQVGAEELTGMKAELNTLLADTSGTHSIVVPQSGLFSSVVDGFESIGPDALEALTPSVLQARFSASQGSSAATLGKLITGITWYYAAVMNAQDAQKLSDKDTAALQFTKTYNSKLEMKIESIGQEENGQCVVVFSARRNMSEIAAFRKLTADIEYSSLSGLSIPKEAVYEDEDGKTYIYLLTGLQAEKVYVDILTEVDNNYIVKDGAENGTVLREGADIIVKGEDLYDGKVVQ